MIAPRNVSLPARDSLTPHTGRVHLTSIDRLAMGSVVCGCVSLALVVLAITVLSGLAAPFGLILTTVAGSASVALGRAALDRLGGGSRELRARTRARVGIVLAVPSFLLFCVVLVSLLLLEML